MERTDRERLAEGTAPVETRPANILLRALSLAFLPVIAVLMVVDLYFIFMWAPTDAILGHVQRIFYFHVPIAWVAFLAFFIVFLSSVLYLWKRSPIWDSLAHSAAEIGVVLRHPDPGHRRHMGQTGVGSMVDVGTAPDHLPHPLAYICRLPNAEGLRAHQVARCKVRGGAGGGRVHRRAYSLLRGGLVAGSPSRIGGGAAGGDGEP